MSGTTGAAGTVRVPALRTRASARATATTAAIVLVVTGWTALTQPESRVGVAVALVVLGVVALVVRRTSASLDLDAGVLVTRRLGLVRALRGQADHVAAGGTPQMSPLAEWLSRGAPGRPASGAGDDRPGHRS